MEVFKLLLYDRLELFSVFLEAPDALREEISGQLRLIHLVAEALFRGINLLQIDFLRLFSAKL